MTNEKIEAIARQAIASETTEKLIELWELTTNNDNPETPTVRGWLMDEIEKRNPAGYEAWLDGDAEDETLKDYILK